MFLLVLACGAPPTVPELAPVPSIAALRTDGFVDQDHGNHSATMKGLEIVGEPALAPLAAALTDTVAASFDPADARFALTVVMVMARIDPVFMVPHAVRVARLSPDRQAAIGALLTLLGEDIWMGRLSIGDPFALPWPVPDGDPPDLAAAFQPHEDSLATLACDDPYLRFLVARTQLRYGSAAARARGEATFQALLVDPTFYWKAELVDRIGDLGVTPASDAVAAIFDPVLLGHTAWALFRLGDPRAFDVASAALEAEDAEVRRGAIALAAESRDVRYVPLLEAHLADPAPNGTTTTTGETTVVHVLGEDAALAIARLTFGQPVDGRDWEALLRARVAADRAALPSLAAWEVNDRVDGFAGAVHPAVLPLLADVLGRPDLDVSAEGPNSFRSGGPPPVVVQLLHDLRPTSDEARDLLIAAMDSRDAVVRSNAILSVATFDREAATGKLASALAGPECALFPAISLVQLGDERGLSELVGCLRDPFTTNGSLAVGTLTRYTGVDLPFDEAAAPEVRATQAAAWESWWASAGPTFTLDLRAAQISGEIFR